MPGEPEIPTLGWGPSGEVERGGRGAPPPTGEVREKVAEPPAHSFPGVYHLHVLPCEGADLGFEEHEVGAAEHDGVGALGLTAVHASRSAVRPSSPERS